MHVSAHGISAQPSAHEKFFQKKHTHAEVVIIQPLPHAFYTKSLSKISNRLISPSGLERLIASDFSAQNYQIAEDTALL